MEKFFNFISFTTINKKLIIKYSRMSVYTHSLSSNASMWQDTTTQRGKFSLADQRLFNKSLVYDSQFWLVSHFLKIPRREISRKETEDDRIERERNSGYTFILMILLKLDTLQN